MALADALPLMVQPEEEVPCTEAAAMAVAVALARAWGVGVRGAWPCIGTEGPAPLARPPRTPPSPSLPHPPTHPPLTSPTHPPTLTLPHPTHGPHLGTGLGHAVARLVGGQL